MQVNATAPGWSEEGAWRVRPWAGGPPSGPDLFPLIAVSLPLNCVYQTAKAVALGREPFEAGTVRLCETVKPGGGLRSPGRGRRGREAAGRRPEPGADARISPLVTVAVDR